MRFIRPIAIVLAAIALAGCGASPTQTKSKKSPTRTPVTAMPSAGLVDQAMGGAADQRVTEMLAAVTHTRQTQSAADIVTKIDYYKDDGTVAHVRSKVKHQAPHKNFVEVISASEPKVVGTKVAWSGEGTGTKANVRTKFIGFWVSVTIDLYDDRLRDQRGSTLDLTTVDRSLDTLLNPQARVTYKADAVQSGKPMTIFEVVSPLSLPGITREVYGIELATATPIMREMYKGEKLVYRMQVESAKTNAKLTSSDFSVD